MSSLTLRVRTQIGTWRVNNVSPNDTLQVLQERLEKEHNTAFQSQGFSSDPKGQIRLPPNSTVNVAKLKNGDMLFATVDENAGVAVHEASTGKKTITKDGQIILQDTETSLKSTGFRPGMLPLRSMKMQWTLKEFVSLDDQFTYKIARQEKSNCTIASLNSEAISSFQNYVRMFDFRTIRVGFLYGTVSKDNKVKVEAIYEPPQESTDKAFHVFEDPKLETVEAIAKMLGMKRVGWIFSHPPREKGFFFSTYEVMFAAEQQLEAAEGVGDTPFVTVKVTLDEKGQAVVEAFQVSKQCMEMVAEGVLQIVPGNLGSCSVHDTFTAVVSGKNVKEVENDFFLVTTPVENYQSQLLVNHFPTANRIDRMQQTSDVKKQFQKVGKDGWSFIDLLADFQLLLFLSSFLSLEEELPLICQSILHRDIPLQEGHELLLRSIE